EGKRTKEGRSIPLSLGGASSLSKRQREFVDLIHAVMARDLSTFLSSYLGLKVKVEFQGVDLMTYGEFVRGLGFPGVVGVFSIEPQGGRGICSFSSSLAIAMVERLLGGEGGSGSEHREPTEVEVEVLRRVMAKVIGHFARGWAGVADFRPKLEALHTGPLFAREMPPIEVGLSSNFKGVMGEAEGFITFFLPIGVVEEGLKQFGACEWSPKGGQRGMKRLLMGLAMEVRVRLAKATFPFREILELGEGDVLLLGKPPNGTAEVLIGGRVVMRGLVGVRNGHMAVKVLEFERREWDGEGGEEGEGRPGQVPRGEG
ncbi:MAG TPA: hypothetical protein EYP65_01600, partial [Armatimonadetes bacterium]|nr:hypothetical protein [Armatimonadota bacterium]